MGYSDQFDPVLLPGRLTLGRPPKQEEGWIVLWSGMAAWVQLWEAVEEEDGWKIRSEKRGQTVSPLQVEE